MSTYLLSTFSVEGEVQNAPSSPEDMQQFMQRVMALEAEMDEAGAFVFGGALSDADTSTTLRSGSGDIVMTDGPFIEAKEQIAGFYIIEAEDLDEALRWARKTVEAIRHPIEVRPFRATGRVQM